MTPSKKIGVGEYLSNLILQLQKIDRENEYYIFTAEDTRHLFPLNADNFHEIRHGALQDFGLSSTLRTIHWLHTSFLSACRRLEIDVVHIPNTQLIFWRNPPTVVSILDLGEWHMRRFHLIRTIYRKLANHMQARLSRAIVTISENSRRDICKFLYVPEDKVTVAYVG